MNNKINPSYKVIADHLRSTAFLIADGILPSNEGRGYVLRRIMRRAMLHSHKLNAKETFIYKLAPTLIEQMGDAFPELKRAEDLICATIKDEEERFKKTLENGIKLLEEEVKNNKGKIISGKIAFKLYDTYGFPLDLTQNILKEQNLEINLEEFEDEMEAQRVRGKESWSGSGQEKEDDYFYNLVKEGIPKTEFLGYKTTYAKAKILKVLEGGFILDKTPFYATSGGQKGDDGVLVLAREVEGKKSIDYSKLEKFADISETVKTNGFFVHNINKKNREKNEKGKFEEGDEIIALVNNRTRQFRAQNHSATHLLHYALKKILGNQVTQKGSNVESQYLTFDFNHNKPVEQKELEQVEDLVNFYIRQDTEIQTEELPIKEAEKKGAIALFGEKYDDVVRVLSMAKTSDDQHLSVEFCGGTHVKRTGNIGLFKIISEKGIAAGVRRIEAQTGYFALQYLKLQEKKLAALLDSLKIKQQFDEIKIEPSEFYNSKTGFDDLSYFANENSADITSKSEAEEIRLAIQKTFDLGDAKTNQIKQKEKEIDKLKKEKLSGNSDEFASEKIGEINLIHHLFENVEAKDLRDLITQIKSKKENETNSIILFFSSFEGKISAALAVSKDLNEKFSASKLITGVVEDIGGKGGGGKPDLAFGGGNDKDSIIKAIQNLKNNIK
jgi:alanyl-tRNA synthetase